MKRLSILLLVCILATLVLVGCSRKEPTTTGATENNPTTSSLRPEPTISLPTNTTTTSGRMHPQG